MDGLQVNITVATITSSAGEALETQLLQSSSMMMMQMMPNHEVQVNTWDELGNLAKDKKAWPRHPRRARELYQSLLQREAQWPERLEALGQGYVLVDPHFTVGGGGGAGGGEEL